MFDPSVSVRVRIPLLLSNARLLTVVSLSTPATSGLRSTFAVPPPGIASTSVDPCTCNIGDVSLRFSKSVTRKSSSAKLLSTSSHVNGLSNPLLPVLYTIAIVSLSLLCIIWIYISWIHVTVTFFAVIVATWNGWCTRSPWYWSSISSWYVSI